jgi:hypothetical protein
MPIPEKGEEVKEKDSEIVETTDGGVEVSIETQDTPKEEVQEEPKVVVKEEKPKPSTDDQSWRNKVFAQDRIIQKMNREIEEMRQRVVVEPSSTKQEVITELDEIDKLAQTDWKAAVNKLAERQAREIIAKEREGIKEQQELLQVKNTLENNTQVVVGKHPELNEGGSEKSTIFQSILSNNPRWRTSPDGPLLVMYEMENELRKRGYDVEGNVHQKVEKEVSRIARVSSTSLPSSRQTISTNKIVLSREQREFCDQNGMSYEDYARTLSKSRGKEGIEV